MQIPLFNNTLVQIYVILSMRIVVLAGHEELCFCFKERYTIKDRLYPFLIREILSNEIEQPFLESRRLLLDLSSDQSSLSFSQVFLSYQNRKFQLAVCHLGSNLSNVEYFISNSCI